MAKHKYIARTRIESGVEEVQFEPQGDAPRVPSRYRHEKKDFGKFKEGRAYTLDPEKVEEAVEEELAEAQEAQAQAEAKEMNAGAKKRSK